MMTRDTDAALRHFDPDDPMMMFYNHKGRRKFVYYCVHGEHESYSIFVGTWKGLPPKEPVFTRLTRYGFTPKESLKWREMADRLQTEANAANAVCWNEVKRGVT